MFSNPEGGSSMEMFINAELLGRAEALVKELISSGEESGVVEGAGGDSGSPQFQVSQSKEGMTVLRTLDVQGQEFFLGMDTGSV